MFSLVPCTCVVKKSRSTHIIFGTLLFYFFKILLGIMRFSNSFVSGVKSVRHNVDPEILEN